MTTSGSPAASVEDANRSALRAKRILFVEDHATTRTTVARLLRRRGFEVILAETLRDARRRSAVFSFDLIISDLELPDGDGCDLMKELRAARPRALPGIAISGFGTETDVNRARAAGFNEHLTKPITMKSLEAVLCRLL